MQWKPRCYIKNSCENVWSLLWTAKTVNKFKKEKTKSSVWNSGEASKKYFVWKNFPTVLISMALESGKIFDSQFEKKIIILILANKRWTLWSGCWDGIDGFQPGRFTIFQH